MPMISADLSSLSTLSIQQKTALERGGIHSVAKLVLTPIQEAARKCRLSPIEVRAIIDTVCKECINISIPCLADIAEEGNELFSTGDKDIDSALGGGIRTGMLWEVVGESAAGKTQFALQLSLFVQIALELGGLEGSCCYLTTSAKLPTERILQISDSHEILTSTECSLSHIHTISAPSVPVLLQVLSRTLPDFIEQQPAGARPVKLIVIDTLAELFHDAQKTTTATLVERSRHVAEIGSLLHTLAAERRVAVVVLNEVVDAFDRGRPDSESVAYYSNLSRWFARGDSVTGEDRKEANLGLAWANQVNARILLSRTGRRRHLTHPDIGRTKTRKTDAVGGGASDTAQDVDDQSTLVRRLNVIFSSVSPSVSLDYIITRSGVSALPDSICYPSLSAEPSTLLVDEARQDNSLTAQHTTPLGIDVADNIGTDLVPLESESENEWDKLWDNDEISAEAYFSFANTS
ncbi:P-loop containing nucleoside triphosphate hydrolase protein [Amanita muscaria]